MKDFVHLHVHTEYSLLDGAARISRLFDACKEKGMSAVAITDHGAMYGTYQFLKEAEKRGIKPIVGCEFYITKDISVKDRTEWSPNHLMLIAKNMTGYYNLVKLNTISFRDGFYYKPRIDWEVLKGKTEGLICLSACLAGGVCQNLLADNYEGALEYAKKVKSYFAEGDFYIELQNHNIPEQHRVNPYLVKIAKELGVKTVATNDVHYIEKSDSEMHDVLLCIQTGKNIDTPNRMKFETAEFYLKTYDEMKDAMSFAPESLETTKEIADKCEVIKLGRRDIFPDFTPEDGTKPHEFLRKLTYERLSRRYSELTEEIKERVDRELDIIIKLGFADYYLIVWDFIEFAKNNNIPVGPGRGSGVGSIVAYITGITDVDPLKYDLLFERFLTDERVSSPDFDIDFCNENRGRVIEYVIDKYGAESVAQIITFGTLAAKAAFKDVARVYNVPFNEANLWTKLFDGQKKADLKASISDTDGVPEIRQLYRENPDFRKILDTAISLEGMPRNTSMHAAGVVISKEPVGENVPLAKNGDDITTQYNMNEMEALGFLKMDFLGLRTLTDISKTIKYIKETENIDITFEKSDYSDAGVYELISSGDTDAVFQLESGGMKGFMRRLKPTTFEEIIAGISLYRPGPMDFIDDYVKGKFFPDAVKYDHPLLEPILNVTNGVIVYQEQVMQIVRTLAGYPLGRADELRRIMSKKKMSEMEKERAVFINGLQNEKTNIPGAVANGIPAHIANKVFDAMSSFAEYAFNKSHASGYAVLSYQTAFLKRYYPIHFITAVINNRIRFIDEITKYVMLAKARNIEIYPPDINKSHVYFTAHKKGIRFGLTGIKGIGEVAISGIIAEREKNGEFSDFVDFVRRTSEFVNKRMLEGLIFAGACDCFGQKRVQLITVYAQIVETVTKEKEMRAGGQFSFFDNADDSFDSGFEYPNLTEYDPKTKLGFEKDVLGMYVTGHPLNDYFEEFQYLTTTAMLKIDDGDEEKFDENLNGSSVTMGGIITAVTKKLTKSSNKMMAFATIEDLYGAIEAVCFPATFDQFKDLIVNDAVVKITGVLQLTDNGAKMIANRIDAWNIGQKTAGENSLQEKGGTLYINLLDEKIYDALLNILTEHRGHEKVIIQSSGKLGEAPVKVKYSNLLKIELEGLLGSKNLIYKNGNM
jgi:DNA polymerase-3 subunit alpha